MPKPTRTNFISQTHAHRHQCHLSSVIYSTELTENKTCLLQAQCLFFFIFCGIWRVGAGGRATQDISSENKPTFYNLKKLWPLPSMLQTTSSPNRCAWFCSDLRIVNSIWHPAFSVWNPCRYTVNRVYDQIQPLELWPFSSDCFSYLFVRFRMACICTDSFH